MNEEERLIHIAFLQEQLREYYQPYNDFRNGKNKKIREAGERKTDNIRLIVTNYLERNNNLHQLFMAFFRGFAYEEALSWRYFHRDIPKFIEHLENLD